MVFSSLTFIFFFLAVTAALYFISPSVTWRNGVLLASSLVFYAWGEPKLVVLMLLVSFIAYLGPILMAKYASCRKIIYVAAVLAVTLNLVIFKYLDFLASSFEALTHTELGIPEISLPIGISFYTFQILSYVIDYYHEKVELQKSFAKLLLYVCLFPQLIAGPIVRYSTVEEELRKRASSSDDITYGIKRFITGLAKKVILANGIAKLAEIIYGGNPDIYGSLMYWLAAVSYSLQLYYDFSAYSDMAIGLGRIFGFHFLENFEHPYTALSVTDFWRRWHISLSSWFRDYIYIPLGGNRVSAVRQIINIMAVWALTGLWHGASWNFVLWGIYYGVLLILEKMVYGKHLEKLPGILRWIYTALIVVIGWVIFNLTDFESMGFALYRMFCFVPSSFADAAAENAEIFKAFLYFIPCIVFMFPVGKLLKDKILKTGDEQSAFSLVAENVWYLLLFTVCIIYLISNQYNPFIYFRF